MPCHSSHRRRRDATRWRALSAWLLTGLLVPGCVVVEERPVPTAPVFAAPVAIPFGAGADGEAKATPHDSYYDSVVTQLQRAWLDRDRGHLARLLDTHDRSDAPSWAREAMVSFRRIVRVMEFEDAVLDRGTLDLPDPLPYLGEPLHVTVRLGPLPSMAIRLLGGREAARARLVLLFSMFDCDSFGAELLNASNLVVDLPSSIDFAAGEAIEVPVAVDTPGRGSILRRVEIEVFLMPGHVEIDGVNLPNRRVRWAQGEVELVPPGHEPIVERPLATLRGALRLGDAAHFPHVFLAARQLARAGAVEERNAASAALIDRVRLGSGDQARSAMAGLNLLYPDATRATMDRTAWLQWWAQRYPDGAIR